MARNSANAVLEKEELETVTDELETEEIEKDEFTLAFESWIEDGIDEDTMIETLHNDFELSYPASVNKLRSLKKAAGLTRPRGQTGETVRAYIKELYDDGKERPEIIKALSEKFGYTDKSAASTYSAQAGKLGILGEGGAKKHPLDVVVAFCRENSELKRADFVKKMAEELDYTTSTAGSFFNYIAFAKEYIRQEEEGTTLEEALEKHNRQNVTESEDEPEPEYDISDAAS